MQFLVTIEGNEEAICERIAKTLDVGIYWGLEDLLRQCIDEGISPLNQHRSVPGPHTKLEVERFAGPPVVTLFSDPDGIMDRPIMDNDSPKGTKVKFAYENAGTNWDIENVKKYLTLGDIYTVAFTEVHSWHTKVFLKEFPGIDFNSVQFAPLKED